MPLFDYQCESCGNCFEHLQLPGEEGALCPHCGASEVKKLVSPFSCTGVQLNKRLALKAKEDMRAGEKMLRGQRMRKKRIKIL